MQNIDMEKIYSQYFKTVYKYLICLTHNEQIAEDLTQETFCKAISKISSFRGDCKMSVWLCQIAKNMWFNELRKNKKISETDINSIDIIEESNIEDDFTNQEKIKDLYKKIQKLEEPIKDIFYLRLLGNLTFKEIAEIIGKSETWTRVNFYRAKQKIREVDKDEK